MQLDLLKTMTISKLIVIPVVLLLICSMETVSVTAAPKPKCPRSGQTECKNTQCCNPDQYCGRNSEECETCFPLGSTDEQNFQLCRDIRNIADVNLKLRDSSCVFACIYRFGDRLYDSCSRNVTKRTEACNQTAKGTTASPDDQIRDVVTSAEYERTNQPFASTNGKTQEPSCSEPPSPSNNRLDFQSVLIGSFSTLVIMVIIYIIYVLWPKSKCVHRGSYSTEKSTHVEEGQRTDDPQEPSLNKVLKLKPVKVETGHQGPENTDGNDNEGQDTENTEMQRLLSESQGRANQLGTSDSPTQAVQETRLTPEERPQLSAEGPQVQARDGSEPHQPNNNPRSGALQTNFAMDSNGQILNPVMTPSDETNARLYASSSRGEFMNNYNHIS